MQNKPNLVRRRRIANVYDTKDYRKKDDFAVRKNKPNSNPIKACPERIEFALSVIDGWQPLSELSERSGW
ncbi:MAG: hypothetical protein ACETWQ_05215 [Phycisphaerae bacterium]